MSDQRTIDKSTAYEMAEYLIAHASINRGHADASVIIFTQMFGFGAAYLFWNANLVLQGIVTIAAIPAVSGLIIWGRSAVQRFGLGGMWNKKNWMERAQLNNAFSDMSNWQDKGRKES
jgi:hypothetical protein